VSCYLTTAYRAVWTALQADDSVLADYVSENAGKWFGENDTDRKPLDIAKSDCPAVILLPGVDGFTLPPATNVSSDVRFPLTFDLRTEGRSVDDVVTLWELLVRATETAWRSNNFGLDDSVGLYLIEWGNAQCRRVYEEGQEDQLRFLYWRLTASLTLTFRRNLETA